jgi:hypothetical protein
MAGPTTRTKTPYVDRPNPRYAANPNAEQKRRQAEAWAALNAFVGRHDGWVTCPPGEMLRIEVMKGSVLPAKLRELGYNVVERGSTTHCRRRSMMQAGFMRSPACMLSLAGLSSATDGETVHLCPQRSVFAQIIHRNSVPRQCCVSA